MLLEEIFKTKIQRKNNININLYIKIQNLELLKYISKRKIRL